MPIGATPTTMPSVSIVTAASSPIVMTVTGAVEVTVMLNSGCTRNGRAGVPSGASAAPDGTPARPFRVQPEFSMTVTSTAPVTVMTIGDDAAVTIDTDGIVVGVAPMGIATYTPAVA